MTRTALLTRVLVSLVLVSLVVACVACFSGGSSSGLSGWGRPTHGVYGVLQSAGLLFFAFAGYARIATLGEEVREPERVIPRAIVMALAGAVVVYAVVAVAVLSVLGASGTAASRGAGRGRGARRGRPVGGRGGPGRRGAGLGRCAAGADRRVWAGPVWRWPASATCRAGWTPYTRATGCRTAPSSPSRPSSWYWC